MKRRAIQKFAISAGAMLIAITLISPAGRIFLSPATAQRSSERTQSAPIQYNPADQAANLQLRQLLGFPINQLKEVVVLQDGRSFVVSNSQGFMVYTVDPENRVKVVGGYSVSDLKQIESLGDGKTFVVSNPNGFMVYQLSGSTVVRR